MPTARDQEKAQNFGCICLKRNVGELEQMNPFGVRVRVLVADDDESILACYADAFTQPDSLESTQKLKALSAELFQDSYDPTTAEPEAIFDLVRCSQGDDAVEIATAAMRQGRAFNVVILDVRMPPGMNGVEAGERIRAIDPEVNIIFVTGYSDVTLRELEARIPPPSKLHYLPKPVSFNEVAQMARDLTSDSVARRGGRQDG